MLHIVEVPCTGKKAVDTLPLSKRTLVSCSLVTNEATAVATIRSVLTVETLTKENSTADLPMAGYDKKSFIRMLDFFFQFASLA